jgi:hypothetical protein
VLSAPNVSPPGRRRHLLPALGKSDSWSQAHATTVANDRLEHRRHADPPGGAVAERSDDERERDDRPSSTRAARPTRSQNPDAMSEIVSRAATALGKHQIGRVGERTEEREEDPKAVDRDAGPELHDRRQAASESPSAAPDARRTCSWPKVRASIATISGPRYWISSAIAIANRWRPPISPPSAGSTTAPRKAQPLRRCR